MLTYLGHLARKHRTLRLRVHQLDRAVRDLPLEDFLGGRVAQSALNGLRTVLSHLAQ